MALRSFSGFLGAIVMSVLAQMANAQEQNGGCFPGGSVKRPEAVSALIASPLVLLERNPSGGARLASEIRDYLGSDIRTLDAVLGILGSANPDQVSAIGAGLGQAAALCSKVNSQAGLRMQQAVAATAVQPLIAAFVAGSNPIDTAAITGGPGPAVAGGPPGGPVTVNTATPRAINAPQTAPSAGGFVNPSTSFSFSAPSRIGGASVTNVQTISP